MLDVLSNLENLTSSINKTNVNYEKANILLMQITETDKDNNFLYSREEMIKRIDNYFNKIK
jgi:hypothetical protein